ncbi:hypothetical protein [Streptomyces sp. NPDC058304]|uniref:hypothetical protein n=1 Tax=Streptomyces sp. NPDC058304 TaxID=3346437 RepID=UPI0036EFD39D
MSTTTTAPDPAKPADDTYVVHSPLSALVATLCALAAAVLSVIDLFANGFGPTVLHLVVGLAVFGAVRLCVGLALNPYILTDDPESSSP